MPLFLLLFAFCALLLFSFLLQSRDELFHVFFTHPMGTQFSLSMDIDFTGGTSNFHTYAPWRSRTHHSRLIRPLS